MDSAWFGGECVPGVATSIDDGFVIVEDAVAELVLTQVLPDVLDRIEFGRIGRQLEQADVVRHVELAAGLMPACTVEQHDSMAAWAHVAADLGEVQVHGLAVGTGRTRAAPASRAGQTAPNRKAQS